METQEIAERLAEYCQNGDFETAQIELYGNDVVSIEPMATPDFEKETKGKDKVFEKIKKFDSMVEESFGNEVSDQIVVGNAIAFKLTMDIKMKGKERSVMSELCVYETKDGKVISEQFFM
jgi:benzoyl-CoA reductase/2-hydroxyglutaryl-CoA dehydratase subunit BcrC/BadD/HgdB